MRSRVVYTSMKTIDLPWEIMQEDLQESEKKPGPDSRKNIQIPLYFSTTGYSTSPGGRGMVAMVVLISPREFALICFDDIV